uniref:CUB domain-containing protein n=1 Tax=Gouania willdenowi TaxID=441366 RepID=A0A8C5CZP4_GOUWI
MEWKDCGARVNGGGGDPSAFFALRSCHQLLQGPSGELFSPDYLCSNPPLWCNWTIQVDPGQRIHLHLEDLTPDESCPLKQDQVYVDEPEGHLLGHKVLQKCWREAKFTSSSNTLHVVLLIGGWPSPPYRGFYGRYQTFGPPVLYNPGDGLPETSETPEPEPEPGAGGGGGGGGAGGGGGGVDLSESEHRVLENFYGNIDCTTEQPLFCVCVRVRVRVCRLQSGVLYILWLQVKPPPGGSQVHRDVHSALQTLVTNAAALEGKAAIVSVSTADVNECGTHLVLCDVNADCVNQFGSYSCHCRPGFRDVSRLGLEGMVCSEVEAEGCSGGVSSEAKGVYVLFFILSALLLMLLGVSGLLYRRHHQGAFLVRCSSSSSSISPQDSNNNYRPSSSYSNPGEGELPPPPPPSRGPRDTWSQVKDRDLPLLRFSSLLPPDGYMDPQHGNKL